MYNGFEEKSTLIKKGDIKIPTSLSNRLPVLQIYDNATEGLVPRVPYFTVIINSHNQITKIPKQKKQIVNGVLQEFYLLIPNSYSLFIYCHRKYVETNKYS